MDISSNCDIKIKSEFEEQQITGREIVQGYLQVNKIIIMIIKLNTVNTLIEALGFYF